MEGLTLPIFAVLLAIAGYSSVFALQCGPCDLSQCPALNCPGGIVDSPCFCCQICAKQFGEVCGGIWDREGTCDVPVNTDASGRRRGLVSTVG